MTIGALGACEDPELNTALRPEGDPEILAVLVGANFDVFSEVPTFCKENDPKVPVFNLSGVQICPEPGTDDPPVSEVTNAAPGAWQVRLVFDELLDPDTAEDLIDTETGGPCTDTSASCGGTLARTQPVTVTCNDEEIAYDGWYDASGNNVTLPLGPSILVFATQDIATGAECSVEVKDSVQDKEGNPVPDNQRGPYEFQIAALEIVGTDPAASDPPAEIAPDANLAVLFNYSIDITSVDPGEITLETAAGAAVPFTVEANAEDPTAVVINPNANLAEGDYVLTVTMGAGFTDIEGGTMTVAEDIVVPFTVVPAA